MADQSSPTSPPVSSLSGCHALHSDKSFDRACVPEFLAGVSASYDTATDDLHSFERSRLGKADANALTKAGMQCCKQVEYSHE